MAKRMKDYQILKCPYCSCEYYDSTARNGKFVGDPMIACPQCGERSYRSSILEPALIGDNRHFDIKFSSVYGNLRIALILIYAVFLFIILITKDFTVAMCFIAAALTLFCLYCVVRAFHKKTYLKSDEYNIEITNSLERLANTDYAVMVIKSQGLDEDSVYYYELHNKE